jgi:tRNA U34 5-carboxymethylaminomethyl modifying GTPase MnmE/TrmE
MSKKPKKPKQEDFNNLLSTLRGLSIQDLILLFIEAKTGKESDIDKIPVHYLEAIEELGKILNSFYADNILDSLFNDSSKEKE